MKKILIAGPDNGMEFGWCLMRWQAKIRYQSHFYDETYVISTPDRMFMYEDFAKPYNAMSENNSSNMWRYDNTEVYYVHPSKALCCSEGAEVFLKYGYGNRFVPNDKNIIAVHMRKKDDGREWPIEKWVYFVDLLRNTYPEFDIVSIGHPDYAHRCGSNKSLSSNIRGHIYPTQMQYMVDIISSSKLCIGPSSGAMHLASLCGCPHLVWTDKQKWNLGTKKGTNRERYETEWNPLNTPVTVVDSHGWNPPVDVILEKVKECLKDK